MAMTATAGRFQVGRVFSNAFGVLGRNAGAVSLLSLVLGVLPSLAGSLFFRPTLPATVLQGQAAAAAATAAMYGSPIYWVGVVIALAGGCILQAAILYIAVVDLEGRRPELTGTVAAALRRALPVLGLTIALIIAVSLASILLLVPGIMLGAMWSVALPALVAERIGVFASLGRSRALTKGFRWPIFGIGIVLLVLIAILSGILLAAGVTAGVALAKPSIVGAVITAVLGAVYTLVIYTVVAAIYVELRTVKEGASTTSLASIFA